MDIKQQGIQGEQLVRNILRNVFSQKNLQQLDWIVKWNDDKYYIIEVKNKDLFSAGYNFPYDGQGLDINQIKLRTQLFNDLGIDTILMAIAGKDLYIQKLSTLEELPREYIYDTKGGIRIYAIQNFKKYPDIINKLHTLQNR